MYIRTDNLETIVLSVNDCVGDCVTKHTKHKTNDSPILPPTCPWGGGGIHYKNRNDDVLGHLVHIAH